MRAVTAIFLMGTLGITGCMPTYIPPSSKPTAELFLAAQNDSQNTVLRTLRSYASKNENCEQSEHGLQLNSVIQNDSLMLTSSKPIVAGEPFVFTTRYAENRWQQQRDCAITASFLPEPGHRYKAKLLIENGVESCRLKIFDTTSGTDQPVRYSMPKNLCGEKSQSNHTNGRPVWTTFKVIMN